MNFFTKPRIVWPILLILVVFSGLSKFALADDHERDRNTANVAGNQSGEQRCQGECGGEETWVVSPQVTEELNRLETIYPETSGVVKYERAGHQYTTYIVAIAAGLGLERAHKIAFYSQYPDDEPQFSATLAAFNVRDLEYRRQIMAVLHSLHGGDHDEVVKRRSDLQRLVSNGAKKVDLTDEQLGLVIHAFADSYAHTTENMNSGDLEAFGYVVGHLFHGHKPDIIAYNPPKYKAYTCALYKALKKPEKGPCEDSLTSLHARIDGLTKSRNRELPEIEAMAIKHYGFNQVVYESVGVRREPPVGREEVIETITAMEKAFTE